jgi:hypothetical protein
MAAEAAMDELLVATMTGHSLAAPGPRRPHAGGAVHAAQPEERRHRS